MAGSLAPTASAALDTVPHKPSVNQPAFSVLGYGKSADYPRCAHAARRSGAEPRVLAEPCLSRPMVPRLQATVQEPRA